ncbi:hypothetical protein ON010_g17945 [Phytophthora cinnamomi]|nr:hypothetical protein ON010_g17945 [Phytophthora cinnamomi]
MEARVEKREALAQEDVSYENLGDEEIRTYEYLEFLRELLDGLSVKKLCQKSGRVVSRTLYITPDILVVFWNPTGTFKQMRTKSSIHTETIQEVLTGIHGSPSVTAKSTPERDALCVSIRCSDGKWLVLQSKTEAMRQRLFLGFSRLAQEKQEQDAAAAAGPEPTIPEVEEEEEEADEYIEKKERQAATTSRVEVSSERRMEQGAEGQGIYEEKAPPPPSEDIILQSELRSVRASYESQASKDDQKEAAQSAGGDDEAATRGNQPFLELKQEEEKENREEDKHKTEVTPPHAADEVDIDNDPELSRE